MSKAAASSSMEVDDTKPSGTVLQRLMITKLVLENFKSYGGRKEIGTFHKVPALAFLGLGDSPVSRLFIHNTSPSTTAIFVCRRPQWFGQIQCDRRHVVCVWQASRANALEKAARIDSQVRPVP